MNDKNILSAFLLVLAINLTGVCASTAAETSTVDEQLNQIEFDHEALIPARTSIYLHLKVQGDFALEKVDLLIDGKPLSNYLYTEREVGALKAGGIHRIFLGDLGTGTYGLTASFVAQKNNETVADKQTVRIEPDHERNNIDLLISDAGGSKTPGLEIHVW